MGLLKKYFFTASPRRTVSQFRISCHAPARRLIKFLTPTFSIWWKITYRVVNGPSETLCTIQEPPALIYLRRFPLSFSILSLSIYLPLSVCLSLSFSFSLSLSLSLYLSLSLTDYLSLYLLHSFSLTIFFLSPSVFLSTSLTLSLFVCSSLLSLYLYLSVSLFSLSRYCSITFAWMISFREIGKVFVHLPQDSFPFGKGNRKISSSVSGPTTKRGG